MLGREINLPVDIIFPIGSRTNDSYLEYCANLQKAMFKAHKTAREVLGSSQLRMKRDYDLKVLERSFNERDIIFVFENPTHKSLSQKLQPLWKGPRIVIQNLSAYTYRIKLKTSIIVAHHDRMKICKDRELPTWLIRYKKNFIVNEKRETQYCLCTKPYKGEFMIQCDSCANGSMDIVYT